MQKCIEQERAKTEALAARLKFVSPANRLARDRESLTASAERLRWLMRRALTDERTALVLTEERLRKILPMRLREARSDLGVLAARLEGLSPAKALSKGYAYVTTESGPVTGVASLKRGGRIRGYVSDGSFEAEVTRIFENEGKNNE